MSGADGKRDGAIAARPVKRRFLNGRMPLCYTEWGDEGAPLVILVHGSRDHSRSWDAIAAALHSRYHIVAPDLRGHGDSSWSQDGRYDFAAYFSDLGALAEELQLGPDRQATLIGHSLGAHIALRFTGACPEKVRRIVAIEAVGAPADIEARRMGQPIQKVMRDWLEERRAIAAASRHAFPSVRDAVERMRSRHRFLSASQAVHLTRHSLRRADAGGWRWKHDPYLAAWPFPDIGTDATQALWRQISCPALLIYGEQSWPSDLPAQLLKLIADARDVRLAGSGHWPQHDALDACLAAIEGFLAEDGLGRRP